MDDVKDQAAPTTPEVPVIPLDRQRLAWLAGSYFLLELLGLLALRLAFELPGQELIVIPVISLMFAQTGLLSGWFAWGDGFWLFRLGLLIGVTLAVHGAFLALPDFPVAIFLSLAISQSVLTALPLFVARWGGWACRVESHAGSNRSPWQYSLAQILILTTVVAVTLRLLLLVPWESFDDQLRPEFIGITLATTAVAWIVWPVVLRFRAKVAYPVVLAGAGVIGMALAWWLPHDHGSGFFVAGIETVVMAGCLSVIRSAGYGLVRA